MYRVCKTCNESFPLEKFWLQPNKKNRYTSCPQCINKQRQEKYKLNIEEHRKQHKEYVLKYRYKLTSEDINNLLLQQDNKCVICKQILIKKHIDHCHKTGKIRGILCPNCNKALGLFKENTTALQNAIKYLEVSIGKNMKELTEL